MAIETDQPPGQCIRKGCKNTAWAFDGFVYKSCADCYNRQSAKRRATLKAKKERYIERIIGLAV